MITLVRIESIIKEGSTLIIKLDAKEKPHTFNCATHTLISFSGRTIKTMGLLSSCNYLSSGESALINSLKEGVLHNNWTYFSRIEPFINNLDMIKYCSICHLPNECPKGYIKWLKENNEKISDYSLSSFFTMKKIEEMPKEHKEFFDTLKKHYGDNSTISKNFLHATSEQKTKIIQIFKISAKEFRWNLENDFEVFMKKITEDSYMFCGLKDWEKYADGNRNFEHNLQIFDEVVNKERNKKILEFESNINFIESFSNDEFTIVIPKTMQDFTDEGKMQNNCVGSYYHDSIADHQNLIYFIRKTSNPNKSYITCRYNLYYGKTTEFRAVNNNDVEDENAIELINKIDKFITIKLKRELFKG